MAGDREPKLDDDEAKAEEPPPGEIDRQEVSTSPLDLLENDAISYPFFRERKGPSARRFGKPSFTPALYL